MNYNVLEYKNKPPLYICRQDKCSLPSFDSILNTFIKNLFLERPIVSCIMNSKEIIELKFRNRNLCIILPLLSYPTIFLQRVRTFQDFQDMSVQERAELLSEVANLSPPQLLDIEKVMEMIPSLTVEVTCETEGEEGIQEGDVVSVKAWVTLKRANGLIAALPHAPRFPFHKEESYWLFLADPTSNAVWFFQKMSFMDEAGAVSAASNAIDERMETLGASPKEKTAAIKEAVEKVKSGSRLAMGKFMAMAEGSYNLTCYVMCDSWIGCDQKTTLKLKVVRRTRAGTRGVQVGDGGGQAEEGDEEEEEIEEEDEDIESEYSDDEEPNGNKNGKGGKKRESSSEASDSDEE